MSNVIKKIIFKQNSECGVEVLPLHVLTATNQRHLITPHRANFYHVFLFENCQLTHVVDFEPIKVTPYTMLFIDKDRVHQFDQSLCYKGYVLVFTDTFFCTTEHDTKFLQSNILFNTPTHQPTLKLNPNKLQNFLIGCNEISTEISTPNDSSKHSLLKNYVHNFLLLAHREKIKQGLAEPKNNADIDYTLRFRDLVENNYTKLKTVHQFAQQIYVSEKRLGQATVEVLGKSPKTIINDRIMLEAKRLLVYTHLSVKQIGQQLGFEDPAYFVRFFKKNANTTPVIFRASF